MKFNSDDVLVSMSTNPGVPDYPVSEEPDGSILFRRAGELRRLSPGAFYALMSKAEFAGIDLHNFKAVHTVEERERREKAEAEKWRARALEMVQKNFVLTPGRRNEFAMRRAIDGLISEGIVRRIPMKDAVALAVPHGNFRPSRSAEERIWLAGVGSLGLNEGVALLLGWQGDLPVACTFNGVPTAAPVTVGRWTLPLARPWREWLADARRLPADLEFERAAARANRAI